MSKMPKRLRNMDLEGLINEFDNPKSPYDSELVIHRVGCLLDNLAKKKEKAEAFFRRLLENGSKGDKLFALGHLARVRGLNEETRLKIREFFLNPENKVLAGKIEQALDQMISSSAH